MSKKNTSDQYLTVSQYAAAKGISTQAVYKQMNQVGNQLSTKVVKVGNRRMIMKSALSDDEVAKVTNQFATKLSTKLPTSLQPEPDAAERLKQQVDQLQDQLDLMKQQNDRFQEMQRVLTEQIEQKDSQIAALNGMIQAKDHQLQDLSDLLKATTAERLQLQAGKKSVVRRLLDSFKRNHDGETVD